MDPLEASVARAVCDHLALDPVPGLVSVYLHGSHARGTPHRESDLDLAFLVDRAVYPARGDRSRLRVVLGSRMIAATGHNEVDLVILNDLPPLFARKIVDDGLRIVCRDPEADHRFVVSTRLRAADLAPFLRRMEEIKLEAIRP